MELFALYVNVVKPLIMAYYSIYDVYIFPTSVDGDAIYTEFLLVSSVNIWINIQLQYVYRFQKLYKYSIFSFYLTTYILGTLHIIYQQN